MVSFTVHAPFTNSQCLARQEIAFTAAAIFAWNALGSGIDPYWSKPTWPGPIALCMNAFTAAPVAESGYFEHTIS